MEMGVVDDFSWRAVGVSALTAGVTAGVGSLASEGGLAGAMGVENELGAAALNGAGNNIATQGIKMLTGQQKSFSWSGVASAATSASLNYMLNGSFDRLGLDKTNATQKAVRDGLSNFSAQAGNVIADRLINEDSEARVNWNSVLGAGLQSYMKNDKAKYGIDGLTEKAGGYLEKKLGLDWGWSNIAHDTVRGGLESTTKFLYERLNGKDSKFSSVALDTFKAFTKSSLANKDVFKKFAIGTTQTVADYLTPDGLMKDGWKSDLDKTIAVGIEKQAQSKALDDQFDIWKVPGITKPRDEWDLNDVPGLTFRERVDDVPDWMQSFGDFALKVGNDILSGTSGEIDTSNLAHGIKPKDGKQWEDVFNTAAQSRIESQFRELLQFSWYKDRKT